MFVNVDLDSGLELLTQTPFGGGGGEDGGGEGVNNTWVGPKQEKTFRYILMLGFSFQTR